MIVSINWLKQFMGIDVPIDELVTLIGSRLVEVEEVIDLGAKYQNVVIADVKHAEKHPNADKLSVVHIDDGGAAKDVARLENGLVEVVCGAPNVREGIKVAWLPPGATVPSTYGKDDFVLEARPLRGVTSNGMIASAKELGIGDDHSGIVEVDKDVPAGTPFAEAYELNDYLLDIENKSLTHRPDCFGLIGFAREVAAIQGKQFTSPEWLLATEPVLAPIAEGVEKVTISAQVKDPDISARYQIVALDKVDASKQSPFAIQTWLARVGIRPISAVVDITNYLMYLTGQPTHAFDLDKVIAEHPEHKPEITVRESREGEELALLDGRTITLASDDILICAGDKPIGLAGAMGGATTEIDENTTRVLVESASFDLFRLRTTQMRHGIFSEAITRFTKGQSPVQTAPVLASAVRMLADVTGARRISEVVDEYPRKPTQPTVEVSLRQVNDLLGASFDETAVADTLQHTEFTVAKNPLRVMPPYWRMDIHITEDVIEEVGRVNGFDNVPPSLPLRPFKAVAPSGFDQTRTSMRHLLARAGANELLTYNFLSSNLLKKSGESPDDAYRLVNSLSPELEYYRTSLLPSLLAKIHPNHKLGYDVFALFELNKTHNKNEVGDDKLPRERDELALVWSAADKQSKRYAGAAYYQAKKYLSFAAQSLNVPLSFRLLDGAEVPEWLGLRTAVFEPKRSAVVLAGDTPIGVVGETKATITKNFKLPSQLAGFELDMRLLHEARGQQSGYVPLSRYPGTSRDICLRVDVQVGHGEVESAAREVMANSELEAALLPVDIYQKDGEDKKQITLAVSMISHEKTITNDEANELVAAIAQRAKEKLGAEHV